MTGLSFKIPKRLLQKWQKVEERKGLLGRFQVVKRGTNGREKRVKGLE